jgi:hypothetical protein
VRLEEVVEEDMWDAFKRAPRLASAMTRAPMLTATPERSLPRWSMSPTRMPTRAGESLFDERGPKILRDGHRVGRRRANHRDAVPGRVDNGAAAATDARRAMCS